MSRNSERSNQQTYTCEPSDLRPSTRGSEALRRGGTARTGTKPMAKMIKAPEPDLHDYISAISEHAHVRAGFPLPFGTQETGGGVNFAIFSRDASAVQLELFDHAEDAVPARVIELDRARNRTGDVWHVWVEGIGPGQLYAYRVDGPYEPTTNATTRTTRAQATPSTPTILSCGTTSCTRSGTG
jgi:hypothetical protein